jgi:hypothetical protein
MSAFSLGIVERSNCVTLIPQEVDHALRLRFAELDKTAVQAVVTAQVEGSVTNARMQEITGEHSKGITGVLQALVRDWAGRRVVFHAPSFEHAFSESSNYRLSAGVHDIPYSADRLRRIHWIKLALTAEGINLEVIA